MAKNVRFIAVHGMTLVWVCGSINLTMKAAKNQRVDLRLPDAVKKRLQSVAELSGRSMSDFIVAAALEKADETMASIQRWELNEEDSRFAIELLMQPRDNAKLRELLAATGPNAEPSLGIA
jgi:uncharacterized protein (DUF1778 family)